MCFADDSDDISQSFLVLEVDQASSDLDADVILLPGVTRGCRQGEHLSGDVAAAKHLRA